MRTFVLAALVAAIPFSADAFKGRYQDINVGGSAIARWDHQTDRVMICSPHSTTSAHSCGPFRYIPLNRDYQYNVIWRGIVGTKRSELLIARVGTNQAWVCDVPKHDPIKCSQRKSLPR